MIVAVVPTEFSGRPKSRGAVGAINLKIKITSIIIM